MADFKIASDITFDAEGGYSNHPNDYGGETKYGISKRSYPHLDIKNLTRKDALVIYEKDYWNYYRIKEIEDQDVANYLFDMLINMNPLKTIVIVQKLLNVEIDGVMGSKTLSAINSSNTGLLYAIKLGRIQHYIDRVESDKSQLDYLVGWIKRALK